MMGRYEYAVASLRDEAYLEDAQEALADVFDILVNVCHLRSEVAVEAFLVSGVACQFESHNPAFIAGKSGTELVELMLPFVGVDEPIEVMPRFDRSVDWWVGWALAYFQFASGIGYREVFDKVAYDEVRSLYHPLHEAPESKLVEVLREMLANREGPTRLCEQRRAAGYSQAQLARAAGVGVRSIQMYEQRNKDINRAQAGTLRSLARALHCSVEDLLEAA